MPDGTSSRVHLLRFDSTAFATEFHDLLLEDDSVPLPLAAAGEAAFDEEWSNQAGPEHSTSQVFTEPEPYGPERVRHAYVLAGDTLALVVQSRKGRAGPEGVPFHRTLILQNQLLGRPGRRNPGPPGRGPTH